MVFIETRLFTNLFPDYLNDDQYRELQTYLIKQPDAGDLIQGTGGLRKLRWSIDNKGKRGGIRLIYYWQVKNKQIYLMTIYAKNELTDLSASEKKILKNLIDRWSI
ncbi:MAG: type II toxin-antitoxin system RelE/ParE family toxin [Gammaproteobacteria bacterium]